jgi:hypothetical protein
MPDTRPITPQRRMGQKMFQPKRPHFLDFAMALVGAMADGALAGARTGVLVGAWIVDLVGLLLGDFSAGTTGA